MRLAFAFVLAACHGCNSQPIRYYEAGPLPDGATMGDGSSSGDGGGTDGSSGPSCSPSMKFGAPMAVAGIAAADKMFGAVTPDELTVAWVTPSGSVQYADRGDASQPFGGAQTLAGTYEHDRVALTGNGLTLVVVMQGAKTFGQVTRAARGQAFGGPPDIGPFKQLLTVPMGGENDAAAPGNVGDPVLRPDGKQMFFSVFGLGAMGTIAVSDNAGSQWTKPALVGQAELLASDPKRRRPTGLTADGLTLFYWDEIEGKEKAAWRKSSMTFDLAFSGFVDLGDKKDAQPTAACTRLYFTNPPAPPSDVKLADKQ